METASWPSSKVESQFNFKTSVKPTKYVKNIMDSFTLKFWFHPEMLTLLLNMQTQILITNTKIAENICKIYYLSILNSI